MDIPVATTDWGDFGKKVKNKRTAMYQNLSAFSGKQQFKIIKEISELPFFSDNSEAKELHKLLLERYSSYSEQEEIMNTEKKNYMTDDKWSGQHSYHIRGMMRNIKNG